MKFGRPGFEISWPTVFKILNMKEECIRISKDVEARFRTRARVVGSLICRILHWQTGVFFVLFLCVFFSVRLLSVLHGHSGFSSPPQRPMTSDFEGFSIPDFIHYIYFPILILEKEPVFPFVMFSAKQGNFWYHFYNVFGMTGDWTRDLPHSKPALYH